LLQAQTIPSKSLQSSLKRHQPNCRLPQAHAAAKPRRAASA